jgi:hypothetical protein
MKRAAAVLLLAACAGPSTTDPVHTDACGDACDSEATDTLPIDSEPVDTVPLDTEPPEPEPHCGIGLAGGAFTPMPDPASLVVERGPQGGWHVQASIRCSGTVATTEADPRHPDQPVVTLALYDESGLVGGYELLPRPMRPTEDGHELLGEFVVIWTSTYEEAVGRAARLDLVLTDATDATYTDSRQVQLLDEALD